MTISDTSFDWTRDCDFVVAHSILSIVAAPNRNPIHSFFSFFLVLFLILALHYSSAPRHHSCTNAFLSDTLIILILFETVLSHNNRQ